MTGCPRSIISRVNLIRTLAAVTALAAFATAFTNALAQAADTSSWSSHTIVPKSNAPGFTAAPPQRFRPASRIDTLPTFKRRKKIAAKPTADAASRAAAAAPSSPSALSVAPQNLRGSTAPQLGEQAYFAFDQGRYLTAIKLATAAASKNDPQAHTLLGRIYRDGHGVPINEIAAAEWFYKGAALGDAQAAFAYGLMAARGRGVQKDLKIAGQFLDTAAAAGNVLAKYNRALIYVQTSQAAPDLKRAFELMRQAAQSSHVPAQYDLGGFYSNAVGVQKDLSKAALWIGKAADAGHAAAQLDYARLLAKGLGLAKDGKKAFDYIRRAALQNNPVAQNRLARFYAYGVEVEPDIIEATKWHLLARAAGVADGGLDQYISRNTAKDRAAAEKLVKAWQTKFAAQ